MVFSSSFVGYFHSEPNIVGYTWLSWFAILLHTIYKSFFTNKRKFNILLSIFPSLIVIYALSCWYGTFFLLASLILTLLISTLLLFAKGLLRDFLFKLRNRLEIKILLRGLPSFSLFLILFIYIYIPVQGDPYRPVSEMISKSPRFNYLFNGFLESFIVWDITTYTSTFYILLSFLNFDNLFLFFYIFLIKVGLVFIFSHN